MNCSVLSNKSMIRKIALFAAVFFFLIVNSVSAETITVCSSGCNYTTIQAAVNAAFVNDTVYVYNGSYYEYNIVVNKPIVIQGQSKDNTIVNGMGRDVFYISTNNSVITGFKITNSESGYAGIRIVSNKSNNITDNIISTIQGYGIYLTGSSNNTISRNKIISNAYGIYLYSNSNNNTIFDNLLSSDSYGMFLWSSRYNIINNNNISNSSYGIYSESSSNNMFFDNIVSSNAGNGIHLASSSYNNFTNNIVSNNAYGLHLSQSSFNILTSNILYSNRNYGIYIESSSYNNLTNNSASNNSIYGIRVSGTAKSHFNNTIGTSNKVNGKPVYYFFDIYSITLDGIDTNHITLAYSYNFRIKNSNISGSDGLYLYESQDNQVINNTINMNKANAIDLYYYSINNAFDGNNVSFNKGYGIYSDSTSGDNNFTSNNAINNSYGIYLNSDNNIINNNNFSSSAYHGLYIISSDNDIIGYNIFSFNRGEGIYLYSSSNNKIENNSVNSNSEIGIHLYYSSNYNTITNNTIFNNTQYGIYLQPYYTGNNYNTITNNTIFNNSFGMYIISSNYSTITNNTIFNNTNYGIYLSSSSNSNTSDNRMCINYVRDIVVSGGTDNSGVNNTCSKPVGWNDTGTTGCTNLCLNTFYCDSCASCQDRISIAAPTDFVKLTQNLSSTSTCIAWPSTFNGTTFNCQGYSITGTGSNYGIYLTSRSYNTIKNCRISNYSYGVYIYSDSNYNSLTNNTVLNNTNYGIYLYSSSNYNTLTNNTVNKNNYGTYLSSSNNNTITNNKLQNNTNYGIYLSGSNNNILTNNTIFNNTNYGIYLSSSNNNRIYLNNLINNTRNAYSTSSNIWNSPQPITYDYNGTEHINYLGNYWHNYTGVDTDGDGIGNTPYTISGGGKDDYPLILRFENYLETTSTTEITMSENSSSTHVLFESIKSQNATLDTSVTGDLDGNLNFTNLEIVFINSGSFNGNGFSKGNWTANIEGNPYNGYWQGMIFKKPGEGKIYLKGKVSGGLIGIVEGYLTESVNGSGVYDKYQATWTISYLGNDIVFAKLNLNGTLNYQGSVEHQSELYVLQTFIEGESSGYYNGSLSIVLNHVRIDNVTNPYYGEGFSVISYVSDHGSGEGWTYDRLISTNVTELTGLFKDPLTGMVSGILNERTSPRNLSISIERIDIGLQPMADLRVIVWGPTGVSPGQTVNYVVAYRNDGLKLANDVVVVAQLPNNTDYVSSTNNGIYYPKEHQVFWKLDSVTAREEGNLNVKIRYHWGLQNGLSKEIYTLIGTTSESRHTTLFDIQKYLTYEPVKVDTAELMPTDNVTSALNAELSNQNMSDLYNYSIELGYNYTKTIIRLKLSNGIEVKRIMMFNESDHSIFVTNINNSKYFLELYLNDTILMFDRGGGMSYYYLNNSYDAWGTWNASGSLSYFQCVANGIVTKSPGWILSAAADLLIGGWKTAAKAVLAIPDCGECGYDLFKNDKLSTACSDCLSNGIRSEDVPYVGQLTSFVGVWVDCNTDTDIYACQPGQKKGICAKDRGFFFKYWDLPNNRYEMVCNAIGFWYWSGANTVCDLSSDFGGPCSSGKGKCIDGECVCDPSSHQSRITVARDPNIKYGIENVVLRNQELNYMVEFENEGVGIAYGVYFTDTLDQDLDDSTLSIGPVFDVNTSIQIAPAGTYNPKTRTITWFVDEVGSREGGYANFSINVKNDVLDGTEIINYATVYFPSVPETTRTNAILSMVYSTIEPVVEILSPESTTYNSYSVNLTFTVDRPTSWIGYSLDGQENVTIYGNITLTGLELGSHNIIVFSNDTYGNMGKSDTIYFTVIECLSHDDCPLCKKCSASNICEYQSEGEDLKDNCPEDSCKYGYCDGAGACKMKPDNTDCGICTLCDDSGNCNVYDTTQNNDCDSFDLTGIATCFNTPDDSYDPTWDFRNAFDSQCITLDTCSQGDPMITHTCDQSTCGATCDENLDCPPNSCSETYNDYCVDKKLTEYDDDKIMDSTIVEGSCDNTCQNDCVCTNCSVDCPSPPTNTYCVKDVCGAECDSNDDCVSGNCNNNCICVIDTTPPVITIESPLNKTYYKTTVLLSFTIDGPASWIGYTLNSTANKTISGPINMTGLANGWNNVKVFANDTYGNMGASNRTYFFYCLADLNGDKVVNILDSILLANNFGKNTTIADLNSDGKTNILDSIILSNNFGKRC